jgi:hypothetical protein
MNTENNECSMRKIFIFDASLDEKICKNNEYKDI